MEYEFAVTGDSFVGRAHEAFVVSYFWVLILAEAFRGGHRPMRSRGFHDESPPEGLGLAGLAVSWPLAMLIAAGKF